MEKFLNITEESTIIANEKNSAKYIKSGELDVFATPSMIAVMENAAMKCARRLIKQGETTVGTKIKVEHLKASPLGEKICAKAKLTAIEGRKLCFEVEAFDSKGLIGKGLHERFIVDVQKFMEKLK